MDLTTAKTRDLVNELRRRAKVPHGTPLQVSQDSLTWDETHYEGTGGTSGTLHILDPDNLDPKPQPQTFADRARGLRRAGSSPNDIFTEWDRYTEDLAAAVDGLKAQREIKLDDENLNRITVAVAHRLREGATSVTYGPDLLGATGCAKAKLSGPDLLEAAKTMCRVFDDERRYPLTLKQYEVAETTRRAIAAEEARRKT